MKEIQTGMQCRDIERLHGLFKELKYFETDRIKNDTLNIYKNKELYFLYFELYNILKEEDLI